MIVKTLEIGWHEAKPIYSCDFQRKGTRTSSGSIAHKFATAGADTHVRIWLIHPTDATSSTNTEKGPKAEYLSTLSKHAGAVNVVRWSPSGDLLASAADDGMLIIWTKDDKVQGSVWGRDPKEPMLDKETWRVLTSIRVTSGEVYDLAWSPTGEYIITGSTDNTARIFSVADNVCLREIADHTHYVQGVAWDPMNEYIATQSSDRSVKLYSVSTKHGSLETHPVGSNSRMVIRGSRGHSRSNSTASRGGKNGGSHSRAPSVTRPSPSAANSANNNSSRGRGHVRRSSISSETSSVSMMPSYTSRERRESVSIPSASSSANMDAPLTPATSVASGFGGQFLPINSTPGSYAASTPIRDSSITPIKDSNHNAMRDYREPRTATTSRRSSFSGSQAPGSPASFRGRGILEDRDSRSSYGRSPSPMPPLPAIRTPAAGTSSILPAGSWTSARLYGDENVTSFFRRLTFSPDGNLLFTPAGWFEDNNVAVAGKKDEDALTDNEKEKLATKDATSSSCVYVYSKANFSKSPVAAYPGHKRTVVGVKFSSVLYELRGGVTSVPIEPVTITLEPGKEDILDPFGPPPAASKAGPAAVGGSKELSLPSPALSAVDVAPTSVTRKQGQTDTTSGPDHDQAGNPTMTTSSVFTLPYRMMFSVATQDSVTIHDTQQAGPICVLSKLHYDSFTDMTWSSDGHVLMLASSDGYCTAVVFDEVMATHPIQQRDLQLKSVALAHSHTLISTSQSSAGGHGSLQPSHVSASSNTGNLVAALGPQSPLVHPPPSPFVPPHAPSPAVSLRELPGPSTHPSASSSSITGPGTHTLKRTASTFDPPLTPAASVSGMDADSGMTSTGAAGESDKERADEGPAKKRRRVELQHHGSAS
ncbi:hypothetical protein FRC15_005260 [Serendipita sp. 397]|nr:hypothetical protein FRC15_005260 [Serendipita sp. 397]